MYIMFCIIFNTSGFCDTILIACDVNQQDLYQLGRAKHMQYKTTTIEIQMNVFLYKKNILQKPVVSFLYIYIWTWFKKTNKPKNPSVQ